MAKFKYSGVFIRNKTDKQSVKQNAKGSKTVMIIPFKSLDEDETENDIDEKTEVYLGNQVFQVEIERQEKQLKKINTKLEKYDMKDDKGNYLLSKNDDEYKRLIKKKSFIETEISKMSKGTIAQVGQMCLMSKMRIYYPTSVSEKLYKVTSSKENIQKIKEKFDELYF